MRFLRSVGGWGLGFEYMLNPLWRSSRKEICYEGRTGTASCDLKRIGSSEVPVSAGGGVVWFE